MSVQTQRGKVKGPPRIRTQRPPVSSSNYSKGNCTVGSNQSDSSVSIFNNADLTYLLGRHCIGNIGEITTIGNDKFVGVIKAISPSGDVGLGYPYSLQSGKNGHLSLNALLIPMPDWKMVRISNVQLSDCLMEAKPDFDGSNECESTAVSSTTEELVPFFASSDTVKDCVLDQGGFPADEMFETNKKLFSVSSSYDPDLPEYTTPVDKTAPNFTETEARCDKLARDIEGSQPSLGKYDEAYDDEEMAFSAVSRPVKDQSNNGTRITRNIRISDRPIGTRIDCLPTTTKQTAHVSIHSAKSQLTDVGRAPDQPSNAAAVLEASGVNGSPTDATAKAVPVFSGGVVDAASSGTKVDATVRSSESTESPSITTATPPGASGTVIKKSTLDPNAPEFQPMGLQYLSAIIAPATQPPLQPAIPAMAFESQSLIHPSINANHSGQLSVPGLTALVAAPQQLYAPSSVPYGSHTSQLPQVFSGAIPNPVTNGVSQQLRGGSLPPSLHQNYSGQINPSLLFQPAQPGISISQLTNAQSPLVAGPNSSGRFSGPVSLARQRSGDPPSTSVYGSAQPSLSVSTFPSPMYQFSQPGGSIPLWLSGPSHMGLHFVPGPGNSSALMVGNIPISQTTGQPIYSAHTMLHMQPTQLSVPTVQLDQPSAPGNHQQLQHHPLFTNHAGQFQEPPHHIQLPQYAPNVLFPQQPAPANYYPASPPVLAGPNGISPSMQPGMFPIINVSGVQHPANGGIAHQQPTLDQSMSSTQLQPQFSHSNCQPPHVQHFGSAHSQLIQSQQLAANQHINSQPLPPGPYANIAALVANAANTSQAH